MRHNLHYDIVVIGAGMGGLLSAALLSREGFKVAVLDKNKQIGGSLQSFVVDRKRFESAVHYIGSLEKGQTLYKIFDYLGMMEQISFQQLDKDCFDEVIIEGKNYALAQGYENFIEKLVVDFPAQEKNLQAYIREIKTTCAHFPLYHLRTGDAGEKKKVTGITLKAKMESIFNDPLLIQVLTANNMLYGGNYDTLPFYIHALIENSYIESSWKCADGSMQIAKALQKIIQQSGGKVYHSQEVTGIHEVKGLVTHVEANHGRIFKAGYFISNLHPAVTNRLIDSNLIKPATRKRLEGIPNTLSAFMINISLKEKTIRYQNYNTYYHRKADVWKDLDASPEQLPNSFALFFYTGKEDPGFATGISILSYMHIDNFSRWHQSHRTTNIRSERGEGYQYQKDALALSYIAEMENAVPGLSAAIQKVDICSPLTYRDYLNIPEGAMYGIKKETDNLHLSTLSTRTKIPNLLLTGQNINIHGILGVSITALLTVGEITGLDYLVNKINSNGS